MADERVDCDTEETRVGVDKPADVAFAQIMVHSSIVQVGHVGHVIALLVFEWVHLEQVFTLACDGLVGEMIDVENIIILFEL